MNPRALVERALLGPQVSQAANRRGSANETESPSGTTRRAFCVHASTSTVTALSLCASLFSVSLYAWLSVPFSTHAPHTVPCQSVSHDRVRYGKHASRHSSVPTHEWSRCGTTAAVFAHLGFIHCGGRACGTGQAARAGYTHRIHSTVRCSRRANVGAAWLSKCRRARTHQLQG